MAKKMAYKIEDTIREMEDYLDSCHYRIGSTTKIVVDRDYMADIINSLKYDIPDDIKKCSKIIANRDNILEEAKARAEAMLSEAHEQTSELVSEHEIMQQAYIQAEEIVSRANEHAQELLDRANEDANNIRIGAMEYTDDALANLQNIMTRAMDSFESRYSMMMDALKQSLATVTENRKELYPQDEDMPAAAAQTSVQAEEVQEMPDEENEEG